LKGRHSRANGMTPNASTLGIGFPLR
jgi:hypothetical protein